VLINFEKYQPVYVIRAWLEVRESGLSLLRPVSYEKGEPDSASAEGRRDRSGRRRAAGERVIFQRQQTAGLSKAAALLPPS